MFEMILIMVWIWAGVIYAIRHNVKTFDIIDHDWSEVLVGGPCWWFWWIVSWIDMIIKKLKERRND